MRDLLHSRPPSTKRPTTRRWLEQKLFVDSDRSSCVRSAIARSGSCKFREKNLVILDRALAPAEQLEVLAEALRSQELESFYLSPAAAVAGGPGLAA